jgi:hypothetical protein
MEELGYLTRRNKKRGKRNWGPFQGRPDIRHSIRKSEQNYDKIESVRDS